MRNLLLLVVVSTLLSLYNVSGNAATAHLRLWKMLITKNKGMLANKLIPSRSLNVSLGISLTTVSDYEPTTGTMRVQYWPAMQWNVSSLSWNPKDFNDVKSINVPAEDLWIPDIVSFAHTDTRALIAGRAIVHSDGNVMYVPHFDTTVLCKDYFYGPRFPRDLKQCRLKLGSWTYHGFTLNLTIAEGKETSEGLTSDLNPEPLRSSGWKFVNATVKYVSFLYPCCPEPYPSLDVDIIIQRTDIYFGLAVTAPGVVTGLLLSLLYLVAPCSPARIVAQSVCLLILVFVAVTDLRLMGSSVVKAPAAVYFVAAMILNLLALLWSILAGVLWSQAPMRSAGDRGRLDVILDKLECVCLLPTTAPKDMDGQEVNLDGEEHPGRHPGGLSTRQRLCLVLDRLLCLLNVILFCLLFGYLGV